MDRDLATSHKIVVLVRLVDPTVVVEGIPAGVDVLVPPGNVAEGGRPRLDLAIRPVIAPSGGLEHNHPLGIHSPNRRSDGVVKGLEVFTVELPREAIDGEDWVRFVHKLESNHLPSTGSGLGLVLGSGVGGVEAYTAGMGDSITLGSPLKLAASLAQYAANLSRSFFGPELV